MSTKLKAKFSRVLGELERLVSEDEAALTRRDFPFLVENQALKAQLITALEGCCEELGDDLSLSEWVEDGQRHSQRDRIRYVQKQQAENSETLKRCMEQNSSERLQISEGRRRVKSVRRGYGARRPKSAGSQAQHAFLGSA